MHHVLDLTFVFIDRIPMDGYVNPFAEQQRLAGEISALWDSQKLYRGVPTFEEFLHKDLSGLEIEPTARTLATGSTDPIRPLVIAKLWKLAWLPRTGLKLATYVRYGVKELDEELGPSTDFSAHAVVDWQQLLDFIRLGILRCCEIAVSVTLVPALTRNT